MISGGTVKAVSSYVNGGNYARGIEDIIKDSIGGYIQGCTVTILFTTGEDYGRGIL